MKTFVVLISTLLISAMSSAAFTADKDMTVNKAADATSSENITRTDTLLTGTADSLKPVADKIVAYYFHGHRRCISCKTIEAYSLEAIQNGFPEQIKNGVVTVLVYNTDLDENKHFLDDYHLYSSSLVITKISNDREIEWKNLDQVWKLKGEKDEFIKYVRLEVKAMLGEE
nr:hypothetical protein [candidate division Zixibacteria bacterium]